MQVNSFIGGYYSSLAVNQDNSFMKLASQINEQAARGFSVSFDQYHGHEERIRNAAFHRALLTNSVDIKGGGSAYAYTINGDKSHLLDQIRQEGLSKEINWSMVAFDLQVRGNINIGKLEQIEECIDFYASEFAFYKGRIEEDFYGEEKEQQLIQLHTVFENRINRVGNLFAQHIGDFFEGVGVDGEHNAMKSSILNHYQTRVDQYIQFISENDNYAQVKDTEDKWLLRDNAYMGEKLRYAFGSQKVSRDEMQESVFSLSDLKAVAMIYQESMKVYGEPASGKSEEQFGVELGLLGMKYELIIGQKEISTTVRTKLEKAFNNYIGQCIERYSKVLSDLQNCPFARNRELYGDLDKNAVGKIIKDMLNNIKAKDINRAFKGTIQLAYEIYRSKTACASTNILGRYKAFYNEWNDFYHDQRLTDKGYLVKPFTADGLVKDWNRFVKSLNPSAGLEKFTLREGLFHIDTCI